MADKLTPAQIIAQIAKDLKTMGSAAASPQPAPFFVTSKGAVIDLRINDKTAAVKAVETDNVLKNPDETIFKNGFAFAVFDKMKGFYSDTSTPQADYSFLFDIMQKDGFFICTGIKFIDFLKEFDICITKIDSSKTGNKRKTILYNTTKENLQKKHGLSTI